MAFSRSQRRRAFAAGFAAVSIALLAAAPTADAHFVLVQPANWLNQQEDGTPIKLGPCGDEDDGTTAVQTGTVTAFQEGSKITVSINEVIFHPGFYRISLATNDRSMLPPEPKVDAGATECGSTTFEDPPVFPVLADDVFEHTTAFSTPQTTTITLPAGVTCENCTLQVIEFMSDHSLNNPGGCFYHHCANLKITSEPVSSDDGGGSGVVIDSGSTGGGGVITPEAGMLPDGDPDLNSSSSGCSTNGGKAPLATGFVAAVFALLLGRGLRRRR